MSLQQELAAFYKKHGFDQETGTRPLTVKVYTGCMLVPLPNIETRHKYIKFHDLHHMVTGYSVGRIGEGEVSAWELGTGSFFVNPILGIMNFIALSTGLVLKPKRMWIAFKRGCKSRNLYTKKRRQQVDSDHWESVDALKPDVDQCRRRSIPTIIRAPEFMVYSILALCIHALIAIPAVILRFVTDIVMGKSLFEAVKPVRRNDLY